MFLWTGLLGFITALSSTGLQLKWKGGSDPQKPNGLETQGRHVDFITQNEKIVYDILFEILKQENIQLRYEPCQLHATNIGRAKNKITTPDLHFIYQDTHYFIEVGYIDNSLCPRKVAQLNVVARGLSTRGSKPKIVYVQLDAFDITELEIMTEGLTEVMPVQELINFLLSRDRLVSRT
ncbi:MAG: hypothetical protein GF381_00765 [Candidatus Pacebacteria bacterium]|nr:hypothetical protein [Candidatus Paceibacterota bacterium]